MSSSSICIKEYYFLFCSGENSEIQSAPQVVIATTETKDGLDIKNSPDEIADGAATPKSLLERFNHTMRHEEATMTPAQRKRFHCFRQQRTFITALTNIAERLRFKDREFRRLFLQRDLQQLVIPPFSYLPLGSSLAPFRSVLARK